MHSLDNADTSKTRCLYQVGVSNISKMIQSVSEDDAILNGFNIPKNEIASHVAILRYIDNEWYVYESHLRTNGVHKQLYSEWIADENPDTIFSYEWDFNISMMEYYVKYNPGYSYTDIQRLALEHFTKSHIFNDNPGLVCSEYNALTSIAAHNICNIYDLPKHEVVPVHWQMLDINRMGVYCNDIQKFSEQICSVR